MASRNSTRKRRDYALHKYQTGSQEYKNEIDNIGCIIWTVIIAFIILIFVIIALTQGTDNALKWLK